MMSADLVGMYVAVALTLMLWSYLYKETILYRFAEYTFIGMASGHLFVITMLQIRNSVLVPLVSKGEYLLAIPLILGVLLYTRYSPKTEWISRWPVAIMVGVGTGLVMRAMVHAQFVAQIISSITINDPINDTVIAVLTACALAFFLFTREQKGIFGGFTRLGRIAIMVGLGASFGVAATTRLTLCISRIQFLIESIQKMLGA